MRTIAEPQQSRLSFFLETCSQEELSFGKIGSRVYADVLFLNYNSVRAGKNGLKVIKLLEEESV